METDTENDTLREEYDFSKLGQPVRGKYAARYRERSNVIVLDDDVARAFPNEKSVNDALRLLMNLAKQQLSES